MSEVRRTRSTLAGSYCTRVVCTGNKRSAADFLASCVFFLFCNHDNVKHGYHRCSARYKGNKEFCKENPRFSLWTQGVKNLLNANI